ncbi:MoaD/ThiS family protein [Chitinophaga horti]|uniref:MoaD/ThiS family protein n=1 Tax=Chitinophaga horti TaxID=2920382 RepID=A0ABY6IZ40_9BACT|nr:MoaD/ThiS family protein [Chitinophaga horti]UYQ91406.1 MoaD/ThiS family protein [Chitinophaga horti]
MSMTILVFGRLQDIVQQASLDWPAVADTALLRQQLQERYPGLASVSYRISVNKELVQGEQDLHTGAEVALLPPFSGG